MRTLFMTTATVAIFALLASAAFAGNSEGRSRATSSIEIEDYSQPWVGATVGFETIASGLTGNECFRLVWWPPRDDRQM